MPIAIPGGEILNLRRGPRRWIPAQHTRYRWRRVLEDAAVHDRTAHLWLHPHNLITGHRQMELLEAVLEDSAGYVRAGRLRNVTQIEFAEAMATP